MKKKIKEKVQGERGDKTPSVDRARGVREGGVANSKRHPSGG